MLQSARLQTIICTTNFETAKRFYEETLGLTFKRMSEGAAVFDLSGNDLRLSPVSSLTPSEHTIVGFEIKKIDDVIARLTHRGIMPVRFDGFPHDSGGILTLETGTRVAWIRDPDGNLLSIVEYKTS